ncbi:MAG: TIGR04053 family radical SAM/SPASM domain-containing protein [Armatimonadetes bacterium]|nr:TIGR04053 family radical SAM/SPASM domain-containing protein [Armatimonadota bacterium]
MNAPARKPNFSEIDFNLSPFIVIWEVTQACDLACLHCRASAQPRRNPLELTAEEGYGLLEDIRRFGQPMLVLTGGDPMKRPEIFDLIDRAASLGLRVAMSPSATPLVTREAVEEMKRRGLMRMAISLDGAEDRSHDAFRRVPGSFQRTLEVVRDAQEIGLSLQINTTVTRHNRRELVELGERLKGWPGMALWSVFFLVPTGRGRSEDEITPEEYEDVLVWLYEFSKTAPFDVKTTAAPHFRRVILQQQAREKRQDQAGGKTAPRIGFALNAGSDRAPKGVNDGNGFVFISHTGEVFPSGFLPVSGGNVRQASIVDIYRDSPLFRSLRDADLLKGKCGACEFRKICGGSRARAYAVYGDFLAEEPFCVYEPGGQK